MRRLMIVLVGLLLAAGVLAPAAHSAAYAYPALDPSVTTLTDAQEAQASAGTAAQIAATPCRSTDHFTGSVTWLEHFFHCLHVPFDVYTLPGSTTAPDKTDDPNNTVQGPPVQPDFTPDTDASGGPACSWVYGHLVERCFQRGVPSLICMQYWSGSYYPYHCGPAHAWNISHSESLWTVVKRLTTSHFAQACAKGAFVGGSTAGVVMKTAGKASGIGIVVSSAMGCVGGLVNYYWKIPN